MSDQPDPNVHLPKTAVDEPTYHMNFNVWNDDIMKKQGFGRFTEAATTLLTHPIRYFSNLWTSRSDDQANQKVIDKMLNDGTYPPQVEKYRKILFSPYTTTNDNIFIWNSKLFKALYGEETYDILTEINNQHNRNFHNKAAYDEDLEEAYQAMNEFLSEKIELPPTADKKLLINSYIIPQQYYKRFKEEYGIPTVPGENTDTGDLA